MMKKLILFTILAMLSVSSYAQVTREKQAFTQINLIQNKVAFVKEIRLKKAMNEATAYTILEKWCKANFADDPFNSSIKYNTRDKEIITKSKVELILPEDSKGNREKVMMQYKMDAFIDGNKCVLEIIDLSYKVENAQQLMLPKSFLAEEFITDKQLENQDGHQELRVNMRKSTIFYFNNLCLELEKKYGY